MGNPETLLETLILSQSDPVIAFHQCRVRVENMFTMESVEEAKIGSDQSIRPAKTWGLPRAVEFGQNVKGEGGRGEGEEESYYKSALPLLSFIKV